MKKKTSIKQGNKNLLKLADILDSADALHRKKKEPTYDQGNFAHPCGTPACALGHWAAVNPETWKLKPDNFGLFSVRKGRMRAIAGANEDFALDPTKSHYDKKADMFKRSEWDALFGYAGCGSATTGKKAAKFIRKFVRNRSKKT